MGEGLGPRGWMRWKRPWKWIPISLRRKTRSRQHSSSSKSRHHQLQLRSQSSINHLHSRYKRFISSSSSRRRSNNRSRSLSLPSRCVVSLRLRLISQMVAGKEGRYLARTYSWCVPLKATGSAVIVGHCCLSHLTSCARMHCAGAELDWALSSALHEPVGSDYYSPVPGEDRTWFHKPWWAENFSRRGFPGWGVCVHDSWVMASTCYSVAEAGRTESRLFQGVLHKAKVEEANCHV